MNKTTERERPGCCTAEIFYEDLSVKKGDWCSNHFRCWSLKNMCCDGLSACINSCNAQTNPTLSFKNKLIISEVNMLLLNASSKFLFNYSHLILKGIPIFFMRWMTKISPSALYHAQSLFFMQAKRQKRGILLLNFVCDETKFQGAGKWTLLCLSFFSFKVNVLLGHFYCSVGGLLFKLLYKRQMCVLPLAKWGNMTVVCTTVEKEAIKDHKECILKFDATWLLVRSADSHWEKKGSLLLSLVLAAFGTMDSSLIFSPQVSVSLFGWCLACTEEQNKAKANRASLYPCTAAFKQEVCLTCSFSHCGLFVCTSLTPPTHTHLPSQFVG